ncbi:phosphoribosylanthranilate isomerase [Alkalibacterium sp. m-11]|uniref:N-(5'-phosphoribosyl)anthranilate isomerase n=1 Tax=Alkalibacterium indicireducens TaxID=398758 RepID=A0ABP3KA85_9LACT
MLVKICGIRTEEAAHAAVESGADMIGLVFAESRRKVTLEQASRVLKVVEGRSIKTAGVFRNQSVEAVNQICRTLGLDYAQLHGDESSDYCRQINGKIIKALSISSLGEASDFQDCSDFLLIDSPEPGSGEAFDWNRLKDTSLSLPYILAGGLTPENVGPAIEAVSPQGVDVSSGVETDGTKDTKKIRRFIRKARHSSNREEER